MDAAAWVIKLWFIILLALGSSLTLKAQSPYLSRRVSLDIASCSLEVALREIGKAADFSFSYDAGLIPGNRLVLMTSCSLVRGFFIMAALSVEIRAISSDLLLKRL